MDLTKINLPLSLEDFLLLQKNMHDGIIKWQDFPDNLQESWTAFKREKHKAWIEDATKRGIIGRYD